MSRTVSTSRVDATLVITIDRPDVRNAVDRPTAEALYETFVALDTDAASVAVLTGAEGHVLRGRGPHRHRLGHTERRHPRPPRQRSSGRPDRWDPRD